MKLGVRGKLFAVSLLLILVVGLAGGVYLESVLKGWLEARIEGELGRHARTARDVIELAAGAETIAALDPVADRLGTSTGSRITIIAAGGAVLGDSELDVDEVRRVENHGQRPEVRAARARGLGIYRRYSTTVGTDMLYVAVPYRGPAGLGAVRAAMPLSEIDQAVGRLRLVLLVAGLLCLGLAVFMSGLASQLAGRAVRRLVDSARAVVKGGGSRRIAVASTDELGRLAGSFNRVVADLDRAVTALAGERDHLETILESLSEGVLAVDAERRVTRLNGAALKLLGLRVPPLGEPLVEATRMPALLDLLGTDPGEADATAELELPGPRLVQAHAAPLRTRGRVIVLRDVTRTRRLEDIRKDLVANVSHELRTPVSVIRANAETLIDGAIDDPERAREFLEAVHRNADRLARIIADLLDLSRIEAGEATLEVGPVAIEPVARRVIDSLEGPARARRVTVELDVPCEARVIGDGRALEQVLLNLVDNAVKYSAQGGHVMVRAISADGAIRIEVEDDGPGIDPRHRERVFERFYRIDAGRSREMGGTGLGLSIVKHLVEAMAGALGLRPAAPSGSVFWFTLPRAP